MKKSILILTLALSTLLTSFNAFSESPVIYESDYSIVAHHKNDNYESCESFNFEIQMTASTGVVSRNDGSVEYFVGVAVDNNKFNDADEITMKVGDFINQKTTLNADEDGVLYSYAEITKGEFWRLSSGYYAVDIVRGFTVLSNSSARGLAGANPTFLNCIDVITGGK